MKTADTIAYERVTYKLGEQASAQRVLAGIVEAKAPDAGAIVEAHERTARLYELLLAGVQCGLLERLQDPLDPGEKCCFRCGHYFLAHRSDQGCRDCSCTAGMAKESDRG